MGILDFLSPALTAGTTAAGAYQQGQAQGNQRTLDNSMTLAQLVRQKNLDDQTRLNADAERRLKGAQTDYYDAGVTDRKIKSLSNQRAYGTLKASFPTHTLAAGDYDEGTDYTSALKEAQSLDLGAKTSLRKQQADYNTLKQEFPNHPLAKGAFDPANPADYTAGLADARDQRKIAAQAAAAQAAVNNRDEWSPSGSIDPASGRQIYYNKRTREEQVGNGIRVGAGGMASGAQAPVADMQQRYQEIAQHAKDLADGKWQMTNGMQTREGLSYGISLDNASGHPPIGKMLGAGAMDALNLAGSPLDFQRYQALMNSTRSLGDDVAKVFKGRQNEGAVLREVALAQLTPDDYRNPNVVEQKLSRLRHVIDQARLTMPGGMMTPSLGNTAPAAPPSGASAGASTGGAGGAGGATGSTLTVGGKTFRIPE